MLGNVKLFIRGEKFYTVYGGPYRKKPIMMKGVKMAAEIVADCDVDIPTRDYQVPDKKKLEDGLRKAVDLILKGEPLYVGCMGGMGRTGLFLAILAKAFRVKSPVPYIRKKYYFHAVETPEQYSFVTKFKIPADVKKKIRFAKYWSYLPYAWSWQDGLRIRAGNNLTRPIPQTHIEYASTLYPKGGLVPSQVGSGVNLQGNTFPITDKDIKLEFSKTSDDVLNQVFKP